jgi:hypothetical protein
LPNSPQFIRGRAWSEVISGSSGIKRSSTVPLEFAIGIIHSRASLERSQFRFSKDETVISKAFEICQQYYSFTDGLETKLLPELSSSKVTSQFLTSP